MPKEHQKQSCKSALIENDHNTQPDLVDQVIEKWQATSLQQMDFTGTEIIGRIVRMNSFINKMIDENLSRYRINFGDFNILAVLLRDENHQLTPGRIQELIFVSSGGLSNRMTRLEAKGLIERSTDPKDRRGVIVTLTEEGKALIEKVAPTHIDLENSLITHLSDDERDIFIKLLKKTLSHVEMMSW